MLSSAILIIFFSSYTASLNCHDFAFGNINGTDESNFKNVTCKEHEQFCISLNGSITLPSYHFNGIVGQCDGAGETAAMLKNMFGFTCWVSYTFEDSLK
ncbi:hypothetical protein OESDEN_07274 [Oesophagostomum dentatum]|uniref:Uncharacterized protein n=1 Tax=Oesophagostomum dentatum TaxID=61180 RepID=A0A0B1T9K2_OESDE|nr:hypothetical protein OESDEN_07274 [Oesophagostomum dentatum]